MKIIKTDEEASKSMAVGMNAAVDLAKKTLGGRGKTIYLDTAGSLHPTLDGVTVLRNFAMNDKSEDMGVKLVLEAAEKQVDECADGTTSVSVLLQALINGAIKNITAGADPLHIKNGIGIAANAVIEEIEKIAVKVKRDSKEIFEIAKVSAHGDESIASVVAEAIKKTNKNSIITVEPSYGTKTYVDITSGLKVNSGWLSPLFVNNSAKGTAELENAYVLIYEGKINELKTIVDILVKVSKEGSSLVIVSDNMEGEALASLAINVKRGDLKGLAINPSGHNKEDIKNRMQDLAIATGGKVYSPDFGDNLNKLELSDLGRVGKVTSSVKETLFVGGNANDIEFANRVSDLETLLSETKEPYEKEVIRGRLAALTGGVGVIYVGGTVDTETAERKDRMDDAKGSALSALENGVVPGGGISLLLAQDVLKGMSGSNNDETTGINIVRDALELPLRQILHNAGLKVDIIIDGIKSRPAGTGYDVVEDEYVDMIEQGILDPAKVEINVVRNASSVAIQFINMGGLITNSDV